MEQTDSHASDIAGYTRRQRRLLAQYATDRVSALPRRSVIYSCGFVLIVLAAGPLTGLLATSMLLLGEAVDLFVLRQIPEQLRQGGSLSKLSRAAFAAGLFQAFGMAAGTTIYVVAEGANSTIMGVIAVLGMATVNAALILPTYPKLAVFKMGVFVSMPLFLLVFQWVRLGTGLGIMRLPIPELMVVLSMAYMCYSFCRAGLDNFQKAEALRKSQGKLSDANRTLKRNRKELLKLSMVARKANDAIMLSTPDLTIEWVNEAFTTLTGIPENAVVGRSIAKLVEITYADPKVQKEVAEAMRAGRPHKTEMRHDLGNGRARWSEMQMLPVTNAEGEVEFFATIARDITAMKANDETMRNAREAAEDAARMKAEFLANMSHEIRTPMTGIIGMADLLSETEQTKDQSDYTQIIIGASRSLLTIINDILDLSKMDAGKLQISNSTFDPRACFDETVSLLKPSAQNKGLALNLGIAPDVPTHLFADDVRLRQIATNMIGNAIKFTEHGHVDVSVWVENAQDTNTQASHSLHFAVQDTGVGIPADKLSEIFEEFTQAESSTTRKFGGTGLGLTISRELTELMGGNVDVTSTVGEGSRFHVWVPVDVHMDAEAEPQAEAAGADAPVYDALDLAGLTVLVAEDNHTNRLLISKYLEKLPLHVRFAHDGYEAVEAVLADPPDLVFMDMSMPRMSGIEATEAIRSSAVTQPRIVALTANAFEDERQACLAAGMDDFLTKPIRRDALVACLQHQIGHRNKGTSAVQSALRV